MAFGTGKPTFRQLADQALDGDGDAAFMLAKRAPDKGFLSFLARWVPEGAMSAEIFNTFADAYRRMELERLDSELKDIKVEEAKT